MCQARDGDNFKGGKQHAKELALDLALLGPQAPWTSCRKKICGIFVFTSSNEKVKQIFDMYF